MTSCSLSEKLFKIQTKWTWQYQELFTKGPKQCDFGFVRFLQQQMDAQRHIAFKNYGFIAHKVGVSYIFQCPCHWTVSLHGNTPSKIRDHQKGPCPSVFKFLGLATEKRSIEPALSEILYRKSLFSPPGQHTPVLPLVIAELGL